MGAIPLPFLFSADRPPSPLVAAFSRVADSGRPAGIPRDLLLLPEGLLSRVLSRPPGLYGQRGPQNVSRRDGISLHPAKSASLFFLYRDRKSTRLNSSHLGISYAVFCLKKKKSSTA